MLATDTLKRGLQTIGFDTENSVNQSIVLVSELDTNHTLTPFQILALEKASYFKADAVFFRYFEDNRPPLAQIYIYDNSNNTLNVEYSQIHKELWSNCNIPTFIIIEKAIIKFFDCRKPVSIYSDGRVYTTEIAHIDLNNIANYADIIEKYNAEKFKNGSFWESEEAHKNYLYGKTAYTNLIDKLKDLRRNYNKDYKISPRLFDYVIIISTLIKFLEENGVDANGDNLASRFFQEQVQCNSFIEILQQDKLLAILDKLAIKFNGGIFNLTNDERIELSSATLTPIINFFNPKVDKKSQYVLWDLYSFKHIPVELISNIYEEFLPSEDKGAVYTPHYLVNFLIDECLPIPLRKDANTTEAITKRTIDISCGSGIFLVNSFKRIVQIYKVKQFYKKSTLPKDIGTEVLQKILKENIFGIDINKNAVELTKFSLQLALCEMLSPKQIWTELTFQDLSESNIVQKDFFDFVTNQKIHNTFDLVIGNPPFNPPLPDNEIKHKTADYFNDIIENHNIENYAIKDNNIALLFLQLSTKLLRYKTGLLCLIQPAVSLLHKKNNKQFRDNFFNKNNVLQIIDFTPLRRILFPSATVPACAVFIQNVEKKDNDITHIVIRRTNPSKERLFFEIDTYDIHSVAQKDASNSHSWKSNLFGGYRLFNLINRVLENKENAKLAEFIESPHIEKNFSLIKEKINRNSGIYFETKITEGIFPKYIGEYTKGNAKILGLLDEDKKLIFLRKYFTRNSSLLVSIIAGTSTRQGLDRPYDVLASDFLNLPILKNENTLTIADKILTNDIAKYKITEFGKAENAITNKEITIRKEKIPIELKDFSKTYLDALNSVYHTDKQKFSLKEIYNTPACFITHFEYGTNNYQIDSIINKNNLDLSSLINNAGNPIIAIKRIAIIHSKKSIYIIKPKQLRYWLKSIALLDADTTIVDIINLNLLSK